MENHYSKLKKEFLDELQAFHLEQGTPFNKLMKLNGKDVDLYVLYNTVTRLGGWESLNSKDGWGLVQLVMNFPNKCVNIKIALKLVYMRYLDSYERCFFNRKKFSESYKHGKKEARDLAISLHPVPLRYNYNQHFISNIERVSLGLSKDIYYPKRFENLALSLISPLPNEHDFAINICLFLSLQPNDFQVHDEPRIIHYLLAHAGMFRNNSLECLLTDIFIQHRGHSFDLFWKHSLDYHKINESLLVYLKELFPFLKQYSSNDTSDLMYCSDIALERILNITTIFNNLTFNELNNNFIAQDATSLNFFIMCCISKFSILNTLGWSILSNISVKFFKNNNVLYFIIQLCIVSIEKNLYELFALEVLTNMVRSISEIEPLVTYISSDFLKLLLNLPNQKDVVLTMRILDFLYYFTGASPAACDCLLSVSGSLVSLIQLLTIEITNEESSWGKVKIVEQSVESDSVNYNCKYSEIYMRPKRSVQPEDQFDYLLDNSFGKNIGCYDAPENDLINKSLINMCASSMPEKTEIDNALELEQGSNVIQSLTSKQLEIPRKEATIDNSMEIIQSPQNLGTITVTPLIITGSMLLSNPIIVGNQVIFITNPLNSPTNNLTITQLYYTQFQPGDNNALETNQCNESLEISSSNDESRNDDSLLIDLDKVNLIEVDINGSSPKDDIFICEWRGCMRNFKTNQQLYRHICKLHCPQTQLKQRCRWFKCVDVERSQYSMMVHILKSHCNKNLKRIMNKSEIFWTNKRMMAAGRKEKQCLTQTNISDFNREHDKTAKEQLKNEDKWNNKEDQLTKSVRLSSAMVIKNIAVNSDLGRKQLKHYEFSLLNIAMSSCESSKLVADILSLI